MSSILNFFADDAHLVELVFITAGANWAL